MTGLIDFPMADKFNAIGGLLVVFASYIFGAHWELFIAFLLLNVIDYVTGVMKSKVHGTESSSSGLKGIIKKFSYWVMVVLAFLMGEVLDEVGITIGADFSAFTPLIGWYTLAALALNEFRSILENLVEYGVEVPGFLIKGLQVATKILKAQEGKFDGVIDLDSPSEEDSNYQVELNASKEELKEVGTVTLKIKTLDDK